MAETRPPRQRQPVPEIDRDALRVRLAHGEHFQLVMAATVVSGLWSLMSGTVAIMAVGAMLRI